MNPFVLASISLSDTDRRVLVIALIIILIAFLLAALIGIAIRHTMLYQSKRADAFMHDVAVTHVVATPKEFRTLGFKKNNRILFRSSLIPFGIGILGLLIWIISNIASGRWGENIFVAWSELFFHFDWKGTPEDPVFVKVFGISLLARFPSVSAAPTFRPEHIPAYIEVFLFLASWIYYAVVCQAYIARLIMIIYRSNDIFEKSLEGFKANKDIDIKNNNPMPPAE